MCWYHMFSEPSTGTFVFRARETPSCTSVCVKMEFHVTGRGTRLEQQGKYEWFSVLVTVRTRKARANQVAYCFWCTLPLCTHPHMSQYRSSPSCIHQQLHVKGSVHLFSRHRETMVKISEESMVMSFFVRCTVWYSVLVLRRSDSASTTEYKS